MNLIVGLGAPFGQSTSSVCFLSVQANVASYFFPRSTGITRLVTLFFANRKCSPSPPVLLSTVVGSPPLSFLLRHDTRSHSRTIFVSQPSGVERATVISFVCAAHSSSLGTGDRVAGMSLGRPSLPILCSSFG